MVGLVLISVFVGLLIAILLMPFRLRIDSDAGMYEFRIPGLVHVGLAYAGEEDWLVIRLWIAGWRHAIYPLRKEKADKPAPEQKKKKAKTKKSRGRSLFPHILSVLKSFRIRHFRLDIDTTDPVWNAWLFPLAVWLSGPDRQLSVNYQRHNALRMEVRNRVIHLVYAWMKPYFHR